MQCHAFERIEILRKITFRFSSVCQGSVEVNYCQQPVCHEIIVFFSFFNKNWIVLVYLYSIWHFLNARFFLVAARVYSLQVEAFFEAAPLARSLSNNCWPLSFVTLQNGKYIRYLHITKVSTMKTETVNACKFCTIFFFPLIILLKMLVNGSISLTYNLMKKFVLF